MENIISQGTEGSIFLRVAQSLHQVVEMCISCLQDKEGVRKFSEKVPLPKWRGSPSNLGYLTMTLWDHLSSVRVKNGF